LSGQALASIAVAYSGVDKIAARDASAAARTMLVILATLIQIFRRLRAMPRLSWSEFQSIDRPCSFCFGWIYRSRDCQCCQGR
jgi:hypothetical protein